MSSTHTGEHTAVTPLSLPLFLWMHLHILFVTEPSALFPAGREDEDHAGDLLDSAVCALSQCSGAEIRQMPQTCSSGQL